MKNVKKNGGFTLVELIVVIAILAILAAVAIPAYSGYIAKAEEANDLQLLGALNTSFNAACVENNIFEMETMVGAQFQLNNGLIAGLNLPGGASATLAATFTADQAQAILNSFAVYYGDNMTTPFKVYVLIAYTEDGFVGYTAEEAEGIVIEAVKQAIANSNFNGKIDELTGDVGTMIDVLSGYLGQGAIEDIEGSGFGTYLSDVLGIEDTSDPGKMANAAVLYMAHTAASMSAENIENAKGTLADALLEFAWDREDPNVQASMSDGIISLLAQDTNSGMAGYAMLYATAEALAIQQGGDVYANLKAAEMKNPEDVLGAVTMVFETVPTDVLENYVSGENSNFQKDMDAYFETLKAVNTKEAELKNELDGDGLLTENQAVLDLINKLK